MPRGMEVVVKGREGLEERGLFCLTTVRLGIKMAASVQCQCH